MPTPDVIKPEVLARKDGANPAVGTPHVLTKRSDFLAASKSGHKGIASSIIVQMNANPSYRPPIKGDAIIRYGLTASKKTGNAVCRNRSKRRMRALVRDVLATQGKAGCDYVLIARHNTARVTHLQLVNDFQHALKQAHNPQRQKPRPTYPQKTNSENLSDV